MVLTLNINSSAMTAGFYVSEDEKQIFRVSVHKRMTPDDFYFQLCGLAGLAGSGTPKAAVVASVAPRMTVAAVRAAEKLCGGKALVIGPGIKTGIDIKINDPSQLGSDLVAMSAGVAAKYELPAVLINISETATVSYIDGASRYLGTIIHPGPISMLQSLVEGAELLNPVPLVAPGRLLGRNTEESILSGLVYGTACFLDGATQKIRSEHPVKTVVATGGEAAAAVLPFCSQPVIYDDSLLTDGMYHIYSRQRASKA